MKFIFRNIALISTALLVIVASPGLTYATAQITDTFIFKGNEYSLIDQTDGNFATPKQFEMSAVMIHTACNDRIV
jgi:hypothetical protein